MTNRITFSVLFILFVFIDGCGPIISQDLKARVDSSLTFNEVWQDPDAFKGDIVLWGGEIIQTIQEKGETFIEVLQWPLNWREEPRRTVAFQGKFLILLSENLGSSLYREGEKITVAGEMEGSIQGDKIEMLSDPAYRYPLILGKQIHIWKDYSSSYSSTPPYPSPYRYNPFERQVPF